ncbi:hypothetical protein AK812_SmicGene44859 [Symbiodinium microadriaticum]|uniref:Reverse transcriptase domain-containing protein n=1 Tax=Symbiodinium microadriaticum TaxID=2951 RepID=A0A1Q9BXD9_SYMMI|nr:hypothetical protein AK812_SmicGene44859 [Symbiodinium microadriaticum]
MRDHLEIKGSFVEVTISEIIKEPATIGWIGAAFVVADATSRSYSTTIANATQSTIAGNVVRSYSPSGQKRLLMRLLVGMLLLLNVGLEPCGKGVTLRDGSLKIARAARIRVLVPLTFELSSLRGLCRLLPGRAGEAQRQLPATDGENIRDLPLPNTTSRGPPPEWIEKNGRTPRCRACRLRGLPAEKAWHTQKCRDRYADFVRNSFEPSRAIIDQAPLEDEGHGVGGDVRPLHDGTHGINLNNKIKILDKLQVSGPEDFQEGEQEGSCLVCRHKAARRNVKVRESDWPRLACKASRSSRVLWLNRVGTFGVSSAAYYWTRLFAAVGRWAFRVLHLDKFYMLIYVDDLHVVVVGSEKFYTLWALFLALEMMGTPFAYHKFKGGLEVDYIGYHLDYFSWAAGISEKRAGWIVDWIDRAESMSWVVTGRQLTEFVGRLNFVTRMITWLKPFLAPLYAWQSALIRGTAAQLPNMAVLVLRFFRLHFSNGARLDSVHMCWPSTDRQVEVFSLEDLPSLFKEDHSSEWASTAAELLGSYAGLVAFGHTKASGGRDHLRMQVCAGTDNKSTPAITAKGLSNKWPVQGIHMQLATTLRQADKLCKLSWRPREENQDADDLTSYESSHRQLLCNSASASEVGRYPPGSVQGTTISAL